MMMNDPRPMCNCCRGRPPRIDVRRATLLTVIFSIMMMAWIVILYFGVIEIRPALIAFLTTALNGLLLTSMMSLMDGINHRR